MQKEFQTQLLKSQIEVQEQTFSTLGKDLHDNICQLLSSATMLLGMTERSLTEPSPMLLSANATVSKAIEEIRSISRSLSKEWLEQFSLIENLQTEANRFNNFGNIRLELSSPSFIPLSSDRQIMIFRIVQEAIQNAIKHAKPNNIFINITEQNNVLEASIKNDGISFCQNEKSNGMGLMNMKHRTGLLGGNIKWIPNNEGCEVLFSMPLL